MTALPGPAEALLLQLAMVAGRDRRGYIEIRHRLPGGGMGQRFHQAHHRLDPLIATVLDLGRTSDVYVGAATRDREHGDKGAVSRSRALWVDCDTRESAERLRNFDPAPTMLLRSGGDHGLHGWWALRDPIDAPGDLERALHRLAHHLGADMACTDAARIMRCAGTANHKHDPQRAVEVGALDLTDFTAIELVSSLADPPGRSGLTVRPLRAGRVCVTATGSNLDDPLLAIPPARYVEKLTGQKVGRDGKVSCPLHEDRTPSLQVYEQTGWFCFGCRRGGRIYQLAGLLGGYALPLRGEDFLAVRAVLVEHFFGGDSE